MKVNVKSRQKKKKNTYDHKKYIFLQFKKKKKVYRTGFKTVLVKKHFNLLMSFLHGQYTLHFIFKLQWECINFVRIYILM